MDNVDMVENVDNSLVVDFSTLHSIRNYMVYTLYIRVILLYICAIASRTDGGTSATSKRLFDITLLVEA